MGFDQSAMNQSIKLIQAENDKALHPSASLLNKKPIMITKFYNPDIYGSEIDGGFANVQTWIGVDSPIKFKLIENVVGYGFTEDQKTKSKDEHQGLIMTKTGVTYILADTFEPYENGFFKTMVDGEMFIHLITAVEECADMNKPSYKISHEPYVPKSDPKYSAIDNQISENLIYMDENRGTGNKIVISKDKYNDVVDRINLINKLQSVYLTTFYKAKYGCFVAEEGNSLIYSPFLTEFIIKHDLLFNPRNDMNIYVAHEIIPDVDFKNTYLETIYYDLENGYQILKGFTFSKSAYDNSSNFSFFNRYAFEKKPIVILDYDENILNNKGNYNPTQLSNFIFELPLDPNDTYFKILKSDKIDMSMMTMFTNFKLRTTDIKAFLMLPLIIYKLKFENVADTSNSYDTAIENLFSGGGYT